MSVEAKVEVVDEVPASAIDVEELKAGTATIPQQHESRVQIEEMAGELRDIRNMQDVAAKVAAAAVGMVAMEVADHLLKPTKKPKRRTVKKTRRRKIR